MDGLSLYNNVPAKLCNKRKIFSHVVEMNNKGILHLHLKSLTVVK